MSNKPDLDEILRDSFVGLWTRTPSDNGMDMEFVEVNDEFDVLKDYLKKEIISWAKSKELRQLQANITDVQMCLSINRTYDQQVLLIFEMLERWDKRMKILENLEQE